MESMGAQQPVAAAGINPAPTLFEERFVDPKTGQQKAVLQWFSTGDARLTLANGQIPTLTSMTQLEGTGFIAATIDGTFQLSSQRSNGLVIHAWLGEQPLLTSKQYQEKMLSTAPHHGAQGHAGVTATSLPSFASTVPLTPPPAAPTSLQMQTNQPAFVPPLPKKGGAGKTVAIVLGVIGGGIALLFVAMVLSVAMLGHKVQSTFNDISNTLPN